MPNAVVGPTVSEKLVLSTDKPSIDLHGNILLPYFPGLVCKNFELPLIHAVLLSTEKPIVCHRLCNLRKLMCQLSAYGLNMF